MLQKIEKRIWNYVLFPWDFLPSVWTTTGAVFAAGATAFFSLFDVVITSFFSYFSLIVVFATYSCSLGAGIYALSPGRNSNDFAWVFLWKWGGERAGLVESDRDGKLIDRDDDTGRSPSLSGRGREGIDPLFRW